MIGLSGLITPWAESAATTHIAVTPAGAFAMLTFVPAVENGVWSVRTQRPWLAAPFCAQLLPTEPAS